MKAFFVSLVLLVSSWVLVVSLLNPKNVKCFISKSSSNRNINSLQMSSFSSLINNHKRIFNPILIPLVGISISLFGSASNAAIFNDPYFQVTFPDSFVVSPKPLKTHEREFLAKSEVSKGYNFGVTVDPVKINDIRDFFKEPSSLANKLVEVEKGKDGVFEVFVLQATQSSVPLLTVPTAPAIVTASISSSDIKSSENMPEIPSSATSYTIEYKVNSSRGQNHYLVKATVVGRRLLVATVQTKDEDYSTLTSEAIQTLDSLMVTDPSNIKK